MRKRIAIFQTSPRRLLSLLLIYLAVAVAVHNVDGSHSSIGQHILKTFEKTLTGGRPLVKQYHLISVCNNKHVQMMFKKRIDACGDSTSPYSVLNFESDPSGGGKVRIKGNVVKKYLCFSRRGRLIYRTNGESEKCVFSQESHLGPVMLRSVAHPDWYVGFNKRGRRLKGFSYKKRKRRQDCFKFTKVSTESLKRILWGQSKYDQISYATLSKRRSNRWRDKATT